MAAVAVDGDVLTFEPVRSPHPGDDLDVQIANYERQASALSAYVVTLDLQANVTRQVRQLRAHAKVVLAMVSYVLDLDGIDFRITPTHRARAGDVADELDELVDTLEWATDRRTDLADVIASIQ